MAREEALVDFIINLEIRMFMISAQQYKISEVKEACFEKREDIFSTVRKVKEEYVQEKEFASDTYNFFNSHQFVSCRKALGIIDPLEMKTDLRTIF